MTGETKTVDSNPRACIVSSGAVQVGMQGLTGGWPSLAVRLTQPGQVLGLDVCFHVTTKEARTLAVQLVHHADMTDAAQAAQGVAA